MRKLEIVLVTFLVLSLVGVGLVFAALHIDTISPSDSGGTVKSGFLTSENLYAKMTTGGSGSKTVRLYVVTSIPPNQGALTDASGGYETYTLTGGATKSVWNATTNQGTYYLVVDEDADGKYDSGEATSSAFTIGVAITFQQSGIGTDTGTNTVLTIDATTYNKGALPVTLYWVSGSTHTVAASSPVSTSPASSKRYLWSSWTNGDGLSGASGTYTTPASGQTVTANYGIQYQLTVNSAYGSAGGAGWYDSGSSAYATLSTGLVDHGNGTRHVFTSWGGDASGTNYASSDAITMSAPKTATANWKTQHHVTYSVTGNLLSVSIPSSEWVDSAGSATGVFPSQVTDTGTRCNFVSDNRTSIIEPTLIVGTYQTQYEVTFDVSPGGTGSTTPSGSSNWYNAGSSGISVSASPNGGYEFDSWDKTGSITIDDSSSSSTTITVDGSGTATANFKVSIVSTTISVQCDPTTVDKAGSQTTTVSGNLTSDGSGVDGASVTLYYQFMSADNGPLGIPSGEDWTELPYAIAPITDSNGAFSYAWDPPESLANGYYWIKASFAGDSGHTAADATTGIDVAHNLLVVPVLPFGTLMAVFSMIAALGGYVGIRRYKFNVKQHRDKTKEN